MTPSSDIPNEVSGCAASSLPSGVCCASASWPSNGQCTCGAFRCWQRDATSCECVIGEAAISDDQFTKTTCSPAPKTKCCQGHVGPQTMNSEAVCGCGFAVCPAGSSEVASCQASGALCAGNALSTNVASCK